MVSRKYDNSCKCTSSNTGTKIYDSKIPQVEDQHLAHT